MRRIFQILLLLCPILGIGQTFNKAIGFDGYREEVGSVVQVDSSYYFIAGGRWEDTSSQIVELEIFITNLEGVLIDSLKYKFDSLQIGFQSSANNLTEVSNKLILASSVIDHSLAQQDGSLATIYKDLTQNPGIAIFSMDSLDVFASIFEIENSLYVYGRTHSKGFGSSDYYVMKTDTLGNFISDTTYGGFDFEQIGNAIKVDEDKIILCGQTATYANMRPFYAVAAANAQFICIDTNFNVLWDSVLYTNGTDFAPMIKEHGFFYYSIEYPVTNQYREFIEHLVGQIDVNTGALLWMDTMDIEEEIWSLSFLETVDDTSFIVFNRVQDPNYSNDLAKIIKYNNQGEIIWQRKYYDGNHDGCYLNAMEVDNDGYLVFGGSIANLETNSQDAWILKLDPNGCLDSTDCGIPNDTVGIIDLTPGLEQFHLNVFPNPASENVTIVVENTANYKHEILELSVYDLSGKLVYRSMQTLTKNIPLFQLDVGNYPSGTYMIQTCVNGKSCGNEILVVDN